ncbi:MAG: hypothetical protein ACLUUO_07085 [Sellimonas intestinalis]
MKKLAFSIAKSRTKFLLLLLVIEMIILSCISPYFFNMNNLLQVTQFGATLTLLSLGEALVMISGRDGIDISIGSTMSLSGVIFGLAVMNGANIPIAGVHYSSERRGIWCGKWGFSCGGKSAGVDH